MDFQVLQDNLEQITLCNIDAEVVSSNSRVEMFVFFIRINQGYTNDGSQFPQTLQNGSINHRISFGQSLEFFITIGYLLRLQICQDQITSSLGEYEQWKSKGFHVCIIFHFLS